MDKKRNISFSPPDISELEVKYVTEVMTSGWLTTGPKVKEFEEKIAKYLGTNKAVCLNSATACLEGILHVLGIGPGDEVIVPAYTYTASASPVVHLGATLKFIDVAKDSFMLDYQQLEEAITEKTKVVIPVDLGGILCDYEKIFEIVEKKKSLFKPSNKIQKAIGRVVVVSDSAHAFGASEKGKMCGNIADFTSFSFHAVKNLTTAEGGALSWLPIEGVDDDELYHEFMLYSLHGQSKDALAKTQLGAWEYDIVSPAYKCNMTNVMAAIGLAQLERYEGLLARRKEIIQLYEKRLASDKILKMHHYTSDVTSSGHLYLIRIQGIGVEERNDIITKLAEQGIASNVHYKPLPMMTAYKNLGFDIKDYPNAYHQYENEISLPVYSTLQNDDVEYICEKLLEILKDKELI